MNDQGQQTTTGPLDLLEALPVMILDVGRDGNLIFANKRVRERLGLPAELEDLTLEDLLDEKSFESAKEMLVELFDSGESDVTSSWKVRPRTGEPFVVDSNAISIYESGYATRVRTYLHDGSEAPVATRARSTPGNVELRAALKEEQEYTKALIQKSGMMVYILDTKSNVVEINKKMESVTGFTRENAPTLDVLLAGLYPEPRYRAIVQRIHENMYTNQHIRETELSISTRSGAVKHVSWSTARLKNARGQVHGFIAMGIEVSEKKRLEQWVKLQSSCFDRVADGVVVSDLKGQIINWVGGAERLLGFSAREMVGKPLSELFSEDADVWETVKKGVEQDGKWAGDLTLNTKGGNEIQVRLDAAVILNEKGASIAQVSVAHDLTREKHLETSEREARSELENQAQALAEREEELAQIRAHLEEMEQRIEYLGSKNRDIEQEANRLASGRVALEEAIKELSIYQLQIQNTTSAAIITLDTTGVVLTWSRGAEDLTNLDAEDAFNRPHDEVFRLDEFDWESIQTEAMEKGQVVTPCTLVGPDDTKQAIVLEVSVLTDEEDRPIGFAEVALRPLVPTELEQDLIESKNLAIVGELAGGIADSISDAFSALTVNFRRLKEYTSDLKKVVELYRSGAGHRDIEAFVRRIDLGNTLGDLDFLFDESEENLVRVRDLARDLNVYLPEHSGDTDVLNLNELAEAAASLVSAELRNRAKLEKDYADPVMVSASRNLAMRVLINLLLSSARSFDLPRTDANAVWIRTALDGDQGVVEISHNGRALPEGIGDNLADFSYLATTGGLPFLALGIANRLVASVGGTLVVEKQDSGARFRITFVCAEADAVEIPSPEEESSEPKVGVLFVDDDKNLLRSYRRHFERYFEIFQANSADEALKVLEVRSDLGAIVMDLLSPKETGLKLLEDLEAQYPDVASRVIVLVPPSTTMQTRGKLMSSGRVLLPEPIDLDSLKTVLDLVRPRADTQAAS